MSMTLACVALQCHVHPLLTVCQHCAYRGLQSSSFSCLDLAEQVCPTRSAGRRQPQITIYCAANNRVAVTAGVNTVTGVSS